MNIFWVSFIRQPSLLQSLVVWFSRNYDSLATRKSLNDSCRLTDEFGQVEPYQELVRSRKTDRLQLWFIVLELVDRSSAAVSSLILMSTLPFIPIWINQRVRWKKTLFRFCCVSCPTCLLNQTPEVLFSSVWTCLVTNVR